MMITLFRGDYNFLSNFAFAKVKFEGEIYSSVEHAYQAAKETTPFYRNMIRNIHLPAQAKRAGRFALLRVDWEEVKLPIMEDLVRKKFSIPYLSERLLATGDQELCENNNWNDTFWGKCGGEGENHLGKTLMKIRKELADARQKEKV